MPNPFLAIKAQIFIQDFDCLNIYCRSLPTVFMQSLDDLVVVIVILFFLWSDLSRIFGKSIEMSNICNRVLVEYPHFGSNKQNEQDAGSGYSLGKIQNQ